MAQDAEARTRGIDQDPVGFAGVFLADGAAVLEQGPHILEAQFLGIIFDEPQFMLMDIAAVDDTGRAAQCGQVRRLAAGSGADVEDDFVRLGIDDMATSWDGSSWMMARPSRRHVSSWMPGLPSR